MAFAISPRIDSFSPLPDGTFEGAFDVAAGVHYTIEASTNLLNWTPLLSFSFPDDGPVFFSDPAAGNFRVRFYRLKIP